MNIEQDLIKRIIEEETQSKVSQVEMNGFLLYLEDDVEDWIRNNAKAYRDIFAGEKILV